MKREGGTWLGMVGGYPEIDERRYRGHNTTNRRRPLKRLEKKDGEEEAKS